MAPRPYTGNTDAAGVTGARPGTKRFQDYLCFLFQMKNFGIYANRTVRGSSSRKPPVSVHATGRAMDTGGTPEQVKALLEFLYAYRDRLLIEELHDYRNVWVPGKGFGAGYRCNRDRGGIFSGWKVYTKNTIGPGGYWVHSEIAPEMADNPAKVDKVFKAIFADNANTTEPTVATTPTPKAKAKPKPVFEYPGAPIKVQSSNADAVKRIQEALKITVDGKFGLQTKKAVGAFQSANNLKVDGIVGPATWAKMFGSVKALEAMK